MSRKPSTKLSATGRIPASMSLSDRAARVTTCPGRATWARPSAVSSIWTLTVLFASGGADPALSPRTGHGQLDQECHASPAATRANRATYPDASTMHPARTLLHRHAQATRHGPRARTTSPPARRRDEETASVCKASIRNTPRRHRRCRRCMWLSLSSRPSGSPSIGVAAAAAVVTSAVGCLNKAHRIYRRRADRFERAAGRFDRSRAVAAHPMSSVAGRGRKWCRPGRPRIAGQQAPLPRRRAGHPARGVHDRRKTH